MPNKNKKSIISQDGKIMKLIPSGTFIMGSDFGYPEERPTREIAVDSFYMDENLVTNVEFRKYCDCVGRDYPASPRWIDMPDYFIKYSEYPVVNISWGEAAAYAEWAGKRLPTEKEWEYAACGGRKSPLYPWGDLLPDGSNANFADVASDFSWRDFTARDGYKYTSPCGIYPPNRYGLYDMAGNAWEWVEDWFFRYDDQIKDTEVFKDGWGGSKVCRGGCYHSNAGDLRVSRRRQVLGGGGNMSVGFRCVKDIDGTTHNKEVKFEYHAEPSQWKSKIASTALRHAPDRELCVGIGGADSNILDELRSLGVTSAEQYVTWFTCVDNDRINSGEIKDPRGKWDFSYWDTQLEVIRGSGIKWLPFIICGPAYSLPDWYRNHREFEGLVCLEHNIESKIHTFWDKNFYKYIDAFFAALSEHYSDRSAFEGLLFGITGDFGESIMPEWHGNWPTQTAGLYHSHGGYWCGDRFARADFSTKMKSKYRKIEKLNEAWGTDFRDFTAIDYPVMTSSRDNYRIDEHTQPGQFIINNRYDRRRVIEFIDWYRDSMTEYVDFWMKTARKYFPDTQLYMCTGGDAPPHQASEFAAQSKVCAKYGGGIRITNEASNYGINFTVTNWVASACTHYGAYYSYEPAGQVTERGVICRIYNAAATNAKGLHYYSSNLLDNERRYDNFVQYSGYFRDGEIKRDIAMLYPDVPMILDTARRSEMLYATFALMRDFTDYVYACDLTIADGILAGVKALIITADGYYKKATLDKIKEFSMRGGIIIGVNIKHLTALETDRDYLRELFESDNSVLINSEAGASASPTTTASVFTMDIGNAENAAKIQNGLFDPMKNFLVSKGVYIPDGKLDGVYMARKNGKLLILNYAAKDITLDLPLINGGTRRIDLSADSISEHDFH